MPLAKRAFVVINLLLGPLVPASYLWSAWRWPEQLGGLWGDLPEAWRTPYTANMPLAAIGYLIFSWYFLKQGSRGDDDPSGPPLWAVDAAYVAILLPSMLWMPVTSRALATGAPHEIVIQIILAAVAIGSLVVLYALARARSDEAPRLLLAARIGALFFCLQTVVLDAVIWPRFFTVPG